MKYAKSANAHLLLALMLFAFGFTSSARADEPTVATITHLAGLLFVTHADGTNKLLSLKSEVKRGDLLKTQVDTYVRLKFVDGGEIVLRPETEFKINEYKFSPNAGANDKPNDSIFLSLLKGGLRSVTGLIGHREPDNFKLHAKEATIGIRGTHFGALLCNNDCGQVPTVSGQAPGNGLHTDTAQGMTTITNKAGTIEVPAGSFSYTANPTELPKLVPPSQGIQVTMPPAISNNNDTGKGIGDKKANACVVK